MVFKELSVSGQREIGLGFVVLIEWFFMFVSTNVL